MKTQEKKKEQFTDQISKLTKKVEELEKFKKKCEAEKEPETRRWI